MAWIFVDAAGSVIGKFARQQTDLGTAAAQYETTKAVVLGDIYDAGTDTVTAVGDQRRSAMAVGVAANQDAVRRRTAAELDSIRRRLAVLER